MIADDSETMSAIDGGLAANTWEGDKNHST
jgi:hypothetical protein